MPKPARLWRHLRYLMYAKIRISPPFLLTSLYKRMYNKHMFYFFNTYLLLATRLNTTRRPRTIPLQHRLLSCGSSSPLLHPHPLHTPKTRPAPTTAFYHTPHPLHPGFSLRHTAPHTTLSPCLPALAPLYCTNNVNYVLQHKSKNYTYMTKKYTKFYHIRPIFATVKAFSSQREPPPQ